MPPRTTTTNTLTGQFSLSQSADNDVTCPLQNSDGSHCRKRCLGEKKYRSMQEHIRRAHPEYYIPKLPATKESFELMINSPPHERPEIDPNHANHNRGQHNYTQQLSDPSGLSPNQYQYGAGLTAFEGFANPLSGGHDGGYYSIADAEAQAIYNGFEAGRGSAEYRRGSLIPAASAAQALAQLHYAHKAESDWHQDDSLAQVNSLLLVDSLSPTNTEADRLQNSYGFGNDDFKSSHLHVDPALEDASFMAGQAYPVTLGGDQSSLLPGLARSPDRTNALPPMQRSLSRSGPMNRARKSSLTQARLGKHERRKSNEYKRRSGDKKGLSTDPTPAALYGKRWEDLIDAAASATEEEEGSRDLTPIPASPYQSPQVNSRTSLPPFALGSQFQSYQASPLTRALTPPAADDGGLGLQPFPSVDSSLSSHQHHNSTDSGSQFHIMHASSIDSNSSPVFNSAANSGDSGGSPMVYCAGCRRACKVEVCYACTSCICAVCSACTDAIISEQSRGRMSGCPKCHAMDSAYKPFQLEFR
ncbi:hypothetical protein HII31_07189 [Pseudocercospora fuligena]|uniref:RING zinc finger-like domain-containing protein n=1 Tax=Pseudocercospora fuligena TaxID=685502 RepID=A0A8H6RIX6_9PEZI|nr:hypothetical protein HII31_07189 [Pseudocercospora fuligena]